MSRKDKTLRSTKKRRTKKRRTKKTRTKKTRTKKIRRRIKTDQEGGEMVMAAVAVIKSELIQSLILYAIVQLEKKGDNKCVKYAEDLDGFAL